MNVRKQSLNLLYSHFFSLLAVYYNYIPNVALFFFLFSLPPLREKDNLVHMLSIDFG